MLFLLFFEILDSLKNTYSVALEPYRVTSMFGLLTHIAFNPHICNLHSTLECAFNPIFFSKMCIQPKFKKKWSKHQKLHSIQKIMHITHFSNIFSEIILRNPKASPGSPYCTLSYLTLTRSQGATPRTYRTVSQLTLPEVEPQWARPRSPGPPIEYLNLPNPFLVNRSKQKAAEHYGTRELKQVTLKCLLNAY